MLYVKNMQIGQNVETILNDLRAETQNVNGLKRTGRSLYLACPFHSDGKERTPSLSINLQDHTEGGKRIPEGLFHCLGCGVSGKLEKLISRILGSEDGGAKGVRWIVNRYPIVDTIDLPTFEIEEDELPDFEPELRRYRYVHPYILKRGVSENILNVFDIGYDRLAQCVTFPIHDERGNVRGIQRRKVHYKQYLNPQGLNKSDYLYGYTQIMQYVDKIEEFYIVEGIIDALVLWSNGIPAVSLMGAIPSDRQIALLKRLPIKSVITCLDNDRAGNDGTLALYHALKGSKILYKAVYTAPVKDVAELTPEQIQAMKKILMF